MGTEEFLIFSVVITFGWMRTMSVSPLHLKNFFVGCLVGLVVVSVNYIIYYLIVVFFHCIEKKYVARRSL